MKFYIVLTSSAICLIFMKPSNASLYNSSDSVFIMNGMNFYDNVLEKENAWIIEFYASWCGICMNFAPIWKQFANDIIEWQHTIKVGVINCADLENAKICQNYDVKSYPHIRLLSSNASKTSSGVISKSREIDDLKMDIIDFLLLHEENNTGANSWVNLRRYKDSVEDIFIGAPEHAKNAVIILESDGSIEGSFTVMDLGSYPEVYVRTMTSASNKGLRFSNLPAIFAIDRKGHIDLLTEDATTREEMTEYVLNHFKVVRKEYYFNISSDFIEYNESLSTSSVNDSGEVFMVDMESALSYAFHHEILLHKTISGETLEALKDFMDVLVRYFPARPTVHKFLEKLSSFVNLNSNVLHASDFSTALTKFNMGESKFPTHLHWIGCMGSQPKYRRYPCGLWTLFHTLTVNAVLVDGNEHSYDPQEPLRAIHSYVKHFFSCGHCSKHFQDMYANDVATNVQQVNDEIIWLWKAHNKVNMRLKGDLSEDPSHAKQLFPPKVKCPSCWQQDSTFNEDKILAYLKEIYGKQSISLKGTEDFVHTGFDSESSKSNKLHIWLGFYFFFPAAYGYLF